MRDDARVPRARHNRAVHSPSRTGGPCVRTAVAAPHREEER